MWSDKYDPAREGVPVTAEDGYERPGPPPWDQPPRMTAAGRAAAVVVGLAAAVLLVAATVQVWKAVDAVIEAL